MNVVFTSDTHAFHKNIIKYCNRPFADEYEMTSVLARNINKSLPNGGLIYHLGDWSMGGPESPYKFRELINKNIEFILIEGNHDESNLRKREFRALFKEIHPLVEVKISGQRMTLCHYAMRVWNKSHHGAWHLYGHSHNSLPDDPNALSIDVGVDSAYARFGEFRPFTFSEIAAIMETQKTFKAVDHHG